MTSFSCYVKMDPVAKERARKGADGHFYTPEKTSRAEDTIAWTVKAAYRSGLIQGPVTLQVIAVLRRPKGCKDRFPTKKPDWDNLGKLVSDALNSVAYKDDAQVVDAFICKRYETEDRKPGFYLMFAEVA
jgi:Holliday junction resolvase RusA-like endonuclease